jgi:predicted small lipoprotein YifL
MKKVIYIALIALVLGSLASCSNKLCPAYGSYPKTGR